MDGNSSTVKIEIRVDDKGSLVIRQLQGNLTKAGRDAEKSFEGLGRQGEMVNTVFRKMIGYLAALKVGDFIKDATLVAARYETLGVTTARAGRNIGYSRDEMAQLEKQLTSAGIAMIESREVLTRMAAAHMDLATAAKLSRAAQDVAVSGNINSSEAFESMVRAIQSGETEILRNLGLNVTFEQSYKRLAQQLHKTTSELSNTEKMQARVNVVLEAASGYVKLYEDVMSTAGKQITSFPRHLQKFQEGLGEAFLPATGEIIRTATDEIKELTETVKNPAVQSGLMVFGKTAAWTFGTLAKIVGLFAKGYGNVTASLAAMIAFAKGEISLVEAVTATAESLENRLQRMRTRALDASIMSGRGVRTGNLVGIGGDTDLEKQWKTLHPDDEPLSDEARRKILDARKELENARLEFLQTAAEQGGDEIGAKLLGLRRDYENAVASLRKELVGAGPEETSALQGVIDYETKKYEIKRGFLEKSLTAEREEQRAEVQLKLAQLQGVDTYEAEIAAIRAKYAKARVAPGSVEGQLADKMETAEITAKERERLRTAVQLRGEYAQMTSDSKGYYAAQVQLLEIEQALAKTAEERQVIGERLAEATARRDGDWMDAANRSLRDYGDTATDVFTQTQLVASSTMSNIEDGFTLMATKGKFTVTDMLRSIQADFTRMSIRQGITGPLFQWAGNGGLTSLFAGILHDGGSAGDPRNLRLVDSRMFLNAPRYHTGKSGEKPTILKDDEWVFTPQQVAALGRSQGAAPAAQAPMVNIYVQSESGTSARVADQRMDFDGDRWVVSAWIRSYLNNTGGLEDFLRAGGGRA